MHDGPHDFGLEVQKARATVLAEVASHLDAFSAFWCILTTASSPFCSRKWNKKKGKGFCFIAYCL